MGLFGGHKTYVASVAYNLAGNELDRPSYLKSAVVGGIFHSDNYSVADMLRSSYLNGPGIKLRNFYRWAVDHYGLVGVPQGFRTGSTSLSTLPSVLAGVIPHGAGEAISITDPVIHSADYSYWADQWMIENHPDLLTTDWTSDYNESTGDILITFADASIATFTPLGFSRSAMYIYATYTITKGSVDGPIVNGSVVSIGSDALPDMSARVLESDDTTTTSVTLDTTTTVVSSYSDGRPDETTGPTTSSDSTEYDEFHRVYSDTSYQGFEDGGFFDDDRTFSTKLIEHQWQDGSVVPQTTSHTTTTDIGGGVIRTDVTTVVTDTIIYDRSYRDDTQDITLQSWSKTKIYIYKIGSGEPDLDAFVDSTTGSDGGYVPFIPVRIDNKFISESEPNFPDLYNISKKAYKKVMQRAKIDDLIDKIGDNASIGDIDYAYVMYGVSLNVLDKSGKKYIYEFFHDIMENQSTTRDQLDDWSLDQEIYADAYAVWTEWQYAQMDSSDPLYGTPEPFRPQAPVAPISEVRIKSSGSTPVNLNFDIQITWGLIEETTGTGLKKPGALKDEMWFEVVSTFPFQRIALHHQVTLDSWRSLTISNMTHRNFIYEGKFVEITAADALNDSEETGFIIPIRYDTLRSMSLIDSTQLSTCSAFIVFNSYLVVKQKWYQTGIFKIFAVILTIAVTVVAGPWAGAAFQGLINVTTGFNPTLTNLIFHFDINSITMLVLVKILSLIAVPIFGEKVGKAIATIAAVVVISVAMSMAGGADFSTAIKEIFSLSAENIIRMTQSVGTGVAVYVGVGTSNIINSNQELVKNYEAESKRISEMYRENFGLGGGVIDPFLLTEASYVVIESEDSFLERTLLTGSDISDMTMKLINDFAKINLEIGLPTR